MSRPSIVLTMIVKDEARVIKRCLKSVMPLLSSWCVVDTGSADDTAAIVEATLHGLPGKLHHRPWRGFGKSRTEAFELARGVADFALVIDADDVLEIEGAFAFPELDHDAYALEVRLDHLLYKRLQLFRLAKPWSYQGVLHEYPMCSEPWTQSTLRGLKYVCHRDGAREADANKYARDVETLERALLEEPDNVRYRFYLAQSLRDAGDDRKAQTHYLRRASQGGWDEEVFVSLLEAAMAGDRLGDPHECVWAAYLRAHQIRPTRAEPLYELARYARERGEFALAWLFAKAAVDTPRPDDVLFLREDVYAWRALDEYAIAAYYTGRFEVALEANARLIASGCVPEHHRLRLQDNLGYSQRALGHPS